jgi:hypothetical protein
VFPVRYEVGFYIPENDILHSHRCEHFRSYPLMLIYMEKYQTLLRRKFWMQCKYFK